MKQFMKALGFALLAGLTYLMTNVVLGLGFGIYIGIAFAEEIGRQGDADAVAELITTEMTVYTPVIVIVSAIMTIGMLMLYFLGRKDKFVDLVGFRSIDLRDGLLLGVFGVFFNLLFIGVIHYVTELLPVQEQMEAYSEIVEALFSGSLVWVLLAVVVAAPVFEEILVRGIIFNDFRKAVPLWVALVIQAFVFGLMHMNWIQSSYAFFLGLALGWIYYKYASVWAPIIVHLTYNLTSTLLSVFMLEFNNDMVMVLGLGSIGSLLLIYALVRNYDPAYYRLDIKQY